MPELPEVETTRRGIATILSGQRLTRLLIHEPRLRWPIPADLPALLENRPLLACERRGKYLLLRFEHGVQLIHLGMSGSLRSVTADEARRKHDHVEWLFPRARLLLHDPRRFGAVLWHPLENGHIESHPLLSRLGVEPLSSDFSGAHLRRRFQGKRTPIKQALLAGDAVVGVGNIYASEALFRARINPLTPAGGLSAARCERLALAVRDTLNDALASGGSTLRDYVNATGAPGAYFEVHAAVYGRADEPCRSCDAPIRRVVQQQRATYYCPRCQRR